MRTDTSGTSSPPLPTGLLAEITAGLASGDDLPQLLERFLRTTVQLAGATAGVVRVLEDKPMRMQLVGQVNLPPDQLAAERDIHRRCGVCGLALQAGGPVWADGASGCSLRVRPDSAGADQKPVLAVPLVHRGQVLGVYTLFFDHAAPLAPALMSLLKAVGELLGLALHNARLERAHLEASLAQERQWMAAEVHDGLAQQLTFVKMRLPLLQDAIRAGDRERAQQYHDDIRGTVGDAHAALRQILADVRTPVPANGLLPTLHELARDFRQHHGLAIDVRAPQGEPALPPAVQAQAVQVVKEALANVVRHAGAQQVLLHLQLQNGQVHLQVEDNGHGFSTPPLAGNHYGIDIMKARARRLGGQLSLQARAGGGTCVHLQFPLPPTGHARETA
jgi:two-component system, NarL family, nitrate/nitrite sensor histidine kinase NarX